MYCFPLTCPLRIFAEFRDVGHKYKMRIRSRVSNLGDLKNPDLRQSVITGDVTPSRIAVMSTEVGNAILASFPGPLLFWLHEGKSHGSKLHAQGQE